MYNMPMHMYAYLRCLAVYTLCEILSYSIKYNEICDGTLTLCLENERHFSFASQCTFRHDETWTKYAYNCVCLCVCAGGGVCASAHSFDKCTQNKFSFIHGRWQIFIFDARISHAYFMFVSYRFVLFRGRGRETNHKHVKSIRVK